MTVHFCHHSCEDALHAQVITVSANDAVVFMGEGVYLMHKQACVQAIEAVGGCCYALAHDAKMRGVCLRPTVAGIKEADVVELVIQHPRTFTWRV